MADDRKVRTGKLARGAITGLAVARAGIAHLGHRARNLTDEAAAEAHQERHEAELGRILFRALNQLKGTALKASQLLSMEGLLPEGMRRELARGFHQATPLNRAQVHKVFRQEFSQDAEALFQRFDAQAFAAASLGQVHRAELQGGERVVVKVQYPGIAASIGSDMRMIRMLLQGLQLGADRLPHPDLIERVLSDIEHKLAEEVDYTHEAKQLRWFGVHAGALGIIVPQPVMSHSTRRILTMQAVDGLHIDAWLATHPTQQVRNRAGQMLFDWFMGCVFEWGRLHADPHPGNFLFLPDGRLAVVDFGCTKVISPAFSLASSGVWRSMLRHAPGDGCGALLQAYVEFGLISPELSLIDFEQHLMPALAPMQAWLVEPFRNKSFDFASRSRYPVAKAAHHRAMAQYITGMREELPYFERAYLGINHMLKTLGAEVSTDNPWINRGAA